MDAITSMSMFKETIKSFFVKWLSTFWNRILFQLMRETPWCDKFQHILTLLKLILKIYYAFKSKYIMEQKIYVIFIAIYIIEDWEILVRCWEIILKQMIYVSECQVENIFEMDV